MNVLILVVTLSLAVFLPANVEGSAERGGSSFGRQFVFTFPFSFSTYPEFQQFYVIVSNQVESTNNFTITSACGENFNGQLNSGESKQVSIIDYNTTNVLSNFDYNQTVDEAIFEPWFAISIHSDDKIGVVAGVKQKHFGYSFLVLPADALDTHYIITTANARNQMVNWIVVVPNVDQNATVNYPTCSGSMEKVTVTYPSVHSIWCHTDLSGLTITSDNEVAVISYFSTENSMVLAAEMLIPDKCWGSTYLLTNFTNTAQSLFKFVTSQDLTRIYVNGAFGYVFNQTSPYILKLNSSEWLCIKTSSAVSVFQIPNNSTDSLFIQIPPVQHFVPRLQTVFNIPLLYKVENYASVVQIGHIVPINWQHLPIDSGLSNATEIVYESSPDPYVSITKMSFVTREFHQALHIDMTFVNTTLFSMLQFGVDNETSAYAHFSALTLKISPQIENSLRLPSFCNSLFPPTTKTTYRKPKSEATTSSYNPISNTISDLSTQNITNETQANEALVILNDTLQYSNQTSYPLTPADVNNVATILCSTSVITGLIDEDFDLYMNSFNQVLNQNIDTLRDAQATFNSSLYFQYCLHYMANNTINSSLLYNGTNIAMGNLDTNCSEIESSNTLSVAFVQYTNYTVELIPNLLPGLLHPDDTVAFAMLPIVSLCNPLWSQKQIVRNDFVLFRGQQLFGSLSNNYSTSINGDGCTVEQIPQTNYVVSIKILTNYTKESVQLTEPISYGFSADKIELLHSKTTCGFWYLDWYTEGCHLAVVLGNMHICRCSHLTDFSLLVDTSPTDPALCDTALEVVGTVVTSFSLIALFSTILLTVVQKIEYLWQLAFLKRYLKRNRKAKSVVGDPLIVTLFGFFFLFAILSDRRVTNMSASGCNVSGAILYTVLMFSMLFAAFGGLTFFKVFYVVFNNNFLNIITSKLFIVGVSLGVPSLTTIILWFSFNPFFVRNDEFCWINPIYVGYAVVIPTIILLIGDIAITTLLIKSFFFSGRNSMQTTRGKKKIFWKKVSVLVTVQFILASPWVFEYFTIGSPYVTAYHYLFTWTNGTQGIWLSIIYMYSVIKFKQSKNADNPLTNNDHHISWFYENELAYVTADEDANDDLAYQSTNNTTNEVKIAPKKRIATAYKQRRSVWKVKGATTF